jgi:predicted methyltransferase
MARIHNDETTPMLQRSMLNGGALALSVGALLGCATPPAPPMMAVTTSSASVTSTTSTTGAPLSRERLAAIVASLDRSAADRANDVRRDPVDMLLFIGARPGSTALDVSTGGGYTTELLARVIGPSGRVYAQSRPRDPNKPVARPAAPEGGSAAAPSTAAPRTTAQVLADRSAAMAAAGVAAAPIDYVAQSFDDPVPAAVAHGGLDLVTLMFNYHDFGYMGVDRAAMNRAIFASLKPGGHYVIADHAGRPGTGISEAGTLHRIEESFLRAEVEAAGFRLEAEGDFLRNPNDPRDRNTPEPPQPKDEFVLKFVKP